MEKTKKKIAFQNSHLENLKLVFFLRSGISCKALNRPFSQVLSGLETGNPVPVGQSPAYDLSVFDEQKAVFLAIAAVSDRSECDSSSLDHPNSSWSIARLKKYLRKEAEFLEQLVSIDQIVASQARCVYTSGVSP